MKSNKVKAILLIVLPLLIIVGANVYNYIEDKEAEAIRLENSRPYNEYYSLIEYDITIIEELYTELEQLMNDGNIEALSLYRPLGEYCEYFISRDFDADIVAPVKNIHEDILDSIMLLRDSCLVGIAAWEQMSITGNNSVFSKEIERAALLHYQGTIKLSKSLQYIQSNIYEE